MADNLEKKYPFQKAYYDFSPVRSACLFVVKALSKLVEEMHNTVYFDFDQQGLILRASDKDTLTKAKARLEYWKEQTKIGILIDNIDKDDYKKFIDNELQGLWKKEKAFINLISYDKFHAACEFLEKKNYKEPLKQYNILMNENKNFALLMCTKNRFDDIKSVISEMLLPYRKEGAPLVPKKKAASQLVQTTQQQQQQTSSGPQANQQLTSPSPQPQLQQQLSCNHSQNSRKNNVVSAQPGKPLTWDEDKIEDKKDEELNNNARNFKFQLKMAIWLVYTGILKIDQLPERHFLGSSFCEHPLVHISSDPIDPEEDKCIQFESKDNYLHIALKDQCNNLPVQQQQQQSQSQSPNSSSSQTQQQSQQTQSQQQQYYSSSIIQQQNTKRIEELSAHLCEISKMITQLKIKIIFEEKPVDLYDKLKRKPSYCIMQAKSNEFIDIFHYINMKNTCLSVRNRMLRIIFSDYLIKKLKNKKNFAYLIAPQSTFAEIKQTVYDIEDQINALDIKEDPSFICDIEPSQFVPFDIDIQELHFQALDNCGRTYVTENCHIQYCVKKYDQMKRYQIKRLMKNFQLLREYANPSLIHFYGIFRESINEQQVIFDIYVFFDYKSKNLRTMILEGYYFTPKMQVKIAQQIAIAINYLHSNKKPIPHGNLKLENILVDDNDNIFLNDMTIEHTSEVLLAPEISIKRSPTTIAGDIWSLGLIYYALFTGDVTVNTDSFQKIKRDILEKAYLESNSKMLKEIFKLILDMLNMDVSKRLNIEQVLDQLSSILINF